jgi:hypothetical protein
MSRIYQSESKANFQGSAEGANFQPVQATSDAKAMQEYKDSLARDDAARNRELTRRDTAETLQNDSQYRANESQLDLESQSEKIELEMDQLVLNNQVELDQLVEKQSLERIKEQQEAANTRVKTVFDTFDSLLKFGSSFTKYSEDMNLIREKQEEEQSTIDNGSWLFASDYDENLGGAEIVEQGVVQLVVENFEEQAVVDAAPNNPIAQERLRTGLGANETTIRRSEQVSLGEAAQQANGRLFQAFFDPKTTVTLDNGKQVTPTSVLNERELSEVIKKLAVRVTGELGVGQGDRKDRLAAIKLYVPAMENAMRSLESQMMTKVTAARQNNAESTGFSLGAQLLQDGDVGAAWREYYSSAWTSGKYNGDKGAATKRAFEALKFNANVGQLRDLQNEPVYFNKDGSPGPLFKNDKRFNQLIEARINDINQGLLDDNRQKNGLQQIELDNAANAFTAALMDADTPEKTIRANEEYELKLEALSDAGNDKARIELANQKSILNNYNPRNANVIREQIAEGRLFSEEFLLSQRRSGKINQQELAEFTRSGLATPANRDKVYGGKASYESLNRGVAPKVIFNLNDLLGALEPEIQNSMVSSIADDIIKRRDAAVNAFIKDAPDAKPGDVIQFATQWTLNNLPDLVKSVKLDKETGSLTGYNFMGATLAVPATAANGYNGMPTYNNARTGKTIYDFSSQSLASLRNSKEAGYLTNLETNKVLTSSERYSAIKAYASGSTYPPSVVGKADALGVDVNDLVRQQAEGAGFTLGARPTQNIPVLREIDDAGGPVDMKNGYQAIKALGFPPRGAAYLAGNIQTESTWYGQREPWDDKGAPAGGIVSWRAGRLTKIEKYLGKPISQASNAEQLRAMIWEMKNEYKSEYRIFMNPNATDAQLRRASFDYWRWGDEGQRFTYARQLL